MGRALSARRVTIALLLFVLGAAAPASAAPPQVVATGLNDPRGIWVEDGYKGDRLLVAETSTPQITEIFTRKGKDAVVQPFAENVPVSDVLGYGFNTAFATVGAPPEAGAEPFAGLARVARGGPFDVFADILAYQETDPDPVDQEENPTETNPFGVAKIRGGFLVADSAGNDLLEIERDGDIETVARFPTKKLPFPEGIPDGPPPGTLIDAESVPTSVAIGPDGAWYVAELTGFPFTPGASRIWRIEPGSEDAECDPDSKRGDCRLYADGFTSVIDIAWEGKTLLVLEIAKDGLLALETAGPDAPPPPGALWVVERGKKTELAPGELIAPGGVAVEDDDAYVTTGTLFGPDAGSVVRLKDALDDDGRHGGGNGHHGDDDDDHGHGGNGHHGHHGGNGHNGDDDDHKGDRHRKKHRKHKGGKHGKRDKHKKHYKRNKRHDD
jgi:hypothetical protein